MSNTGATNKQIEAAAKRYYDAMPESNWLEDGFDKPVWETENQATKDAWIAETRAAAEHMIPPGYALIEPVQIAALRRVLADPTVRSRKLTYLYDDLDTLAALIGETT